MEASELRTFSVDELRGRVRQWKEELFRTRFKTETQEARDTSVVKKLRRDIARGLTVLNEKLRGVEVKSAAPTAPKPAKRVAAPPPESAEGTPAEAEDKPAKSKAQTGKSSAKKPAAKKTKEKVK